MRLFVLRLGDHIHYSTDFRHAMRTASAIVYPDAVHRERARSLSDFPKLTEINAAGSFHQLVRLTAVQRKLEPFLIEEHLLGGPPLSPTLVEVTDALEDLDPSFIIQTALWTYMIADRQLDADKIADEIERTVASKVSTLRKLGQPDETILSKMTDIEARMQGIKVVPQIGSPKRILDKLPVTASEAFLAIVDEIQ